MRKNRELKIVKIKTIHKHLSALQTAILINFSKLNVQDLEKFRQKLKTIDAQVSVYKNSLLKRALVNTAYAKLGEGLKGSLMVAFSTTESLPLIKAVHNFQKQHSSISFRGGFFQDQILNPEQILNLAQLPSITESLGSFVGLLQGPLVNLITILESKVTQMSV